jgi:hypothetical protein
MNSIGIVKPEIPKRSRHCMQCQTSFLPGAIVSSWLFQNEKGDFYRCDKCQHCLEIKCDIQSNEALIHWKLRIAENEKKNENKPEMLPEGAAFTILKEELEANTLKAHQKAFVLSIYLLRKKYLILHGSSKEGNKEFSLYEAPQLGEIIAVPKVNVAEIPIDTIKKEISQKIKALVKGN